MELPGALAVLGGGGAVVDLVKDLGLRVKGSGFRVQGLGFRVWGLGFRVEG